MRTPRQIAFALLLDWEKNATFPNLALKKELRSVSAPRDRRFITALVYGVIERKITLDHFIAKTSSRPPEKLSKDVLSALRMGVYQMFYMEVPSSAACNTTVELLKQMHLYKVTGFCNAVLRACADQKEELLLLKKTDYSVRYSINVELVDLLLEQYGKEKFVSMMEALQMKRDLMFLYLNHNKGTPADLISLLGEEGISVSETDIPNLFCSEHGFAVEDSAAYQAGWYHIVGYHSAQAAALCPTDALDVMDLCAAPGGKTFILASNPSRRVRAFDVHPHKIDNLKRNIQRLGLHNVATKLRDGTTYEVADAESADFVLCDVPCSGLGIMGKKPDIKYKKYCSADFTEIQKRILENGFGYLKKGGSLVYSTCTVDRRENDLLIESFLKDHPQYELVQEQQFLPNESEDGFYIALIKKG